MRRIAAIVQYDGTKFNGFQGQPNVRTVQGTIEDALEKIFKTRIFTQAAGRTDTGVHAVMQVVAFNCPSEKMTLKNIKDAMNANLPSDIYVKKVFEVPRNFNPRFHVKKRVYHYYILNSKEPNIFLRNLVWWFPYTLDIDRMRKAAAFLEGEHDFTSLRKSGDERNPIRTIYRIRILKKRDFILIRVEGNSFLRRMVRNIVGLLVRVGTGEWKPEKVLEVLQAKDRRAAAGTAPAHGLYLQKVIF
ncbi:MAG TPA: tRNA pseudouridine(38-40) synthase TruA [Thermotogaceae bacterium]|nr:tRNA pseudouridine(38-40) synthase TruA [Thermotogota bacterium]HEW91200.1 tRNA pseudouridine(38-40) synthase TruA [Thermotogaceae bacterium]